MDRERHCLESLDPGNESQNPRFQEGTWEADLNCKPESGSEVCFPWSSFGVGQLNGRPVALFQTGPLKLQDLWHLLAGGLFPRTQPKLSEALSLNSCIAPIRGLVTPPEANPKEKHALTEVVTHRQGVKEPSQDQAVPKSREARREEKPYA